MRRTLFGWACVIALALALQSSAAPAADLQAQTFYSGFFNDYQKLEVAGFDLDYRVNFKRIPSLKKLGRRLEVLRAARLRLLAIPRDALSPQARFTFDAVRWGLDLQIRRAELEQAFRQRVPTGGAPDGGLQKLPDGREWYLFYLQSMGLGVDNPSSLIPIGERGLARAIDEIHAIQKALGYAGRDAAFSEFIHGSRFYLTDQEQIEHRLRQVRAIVDSHLAIDFEPMEIASVKIAPWPNATRDSAPGYFSKGTFYYTFFDNRFALSALDFLYLHEAIPGHFYQSQVAAHSNLPTFHDFYSCSGFVEGWGAYAEDLGTDMGCYTDPIQRLGRWQWDLARCARVILDVRINHEGWTRERALAWWRAHVPFENDIAEREVDRVIHWPAQSQSYKMGELHLLTLRAKARQAEGDSFDVRRFHRVVLGHGAVPFGVVDEIFDDALEHHVMRR